MASLFLVNATPQYDRYAKKLLRRHPEFNHAEARAREILYVDPHNRTRNHHIKKLTNTEKGDGPYRLGRFRFRYDIFDKKVILHFCGLRRENTYQ